MKNDPEHDMFTVEEFLSAVKSMVSGQSIVYHVGLLSHDRQYDENVRRIGNAARRLGFPRDVPLRFTGPIPTTPSPDIPNDDLRFGKGVGVLMQERVEEGVCNYIFTKL